MRHELGGNLPRKIHIESSPYIDFSQFAALADEVDIEFGALLCQSRGFGVRLRIHGNVFSRRHRHRAGDHCCGAAEQDSGVRGVRSGNAQDQTGSRDDAVVRAQNAGAQPANPAQTVTFMTVRTHDAYTNSESTASQSTALRTLGACPSNDRRSEGATHASHGWPGWPARSDCEAGIAQQSAAVGASLLGQAPRPCRSWVPENTKVRNRARAG